MILQVYKLIDIVWPTSLLAVMLLQMPQVTNAAHGGSSANNQYQQKNYSSHVQYGTNKGTQTCMLISVRQNGGGALSVTPVRAFVLAFVCSCVRPSVIKIWCPLNNF